MKAKGRVAEASPDASIHWRADRDHFIHPYTDFSTFAEEGSQVISAAQGVMVTDEQGKEYLDAIAGLWCVNIGHGREEMADVIRDQVARMQYYNPFGHSTNEPAALLAAKLAELSPGSLNHVFYSTGGSTANDMAVRIAHYYFDIQDLPDKKTIISRHDAYHGSTYFAANLTGIQGRKSGFNQIASDIIEYVSAPNMYRMPEGMNEEAYCDFLVDEFEQKLVETGPDRVAAFLAEPLMGAGGVLVAPHGYHARIQAVCRANDVLYIADEVVTAFGRLGEWFASEELYGTTPDIIVSAKGISSGYIPLGATLISDEIYDAISKPRKTDSVFSMGFTYSGHPVACTAALTNIEIMEREDLPGRVRREGHQLLDHLQPLRDLSIVGDVRGSHYMAGIELVADKQTKRNFDAAVNCTERVFRHCLERGVIVRPVGNVLILSPPLVFDTGHCRTTAAALYDSIEQTTADLRAEGLLADGVRESPATS